MHSCRLPWRIVDEQLGRDGVFEDIRWGRGDDQSPFHHCGDLKKRLPSVQQADSAGYEKEAIIYEKKIRDSLVLPTLNVFQLPGAIELIILGSVWQSSSSR